MSAKFSCVLLNIVLPALRRCRRWGWQRTKEKLHEKVLSLFSVVFLCLVKCARRGSRPKENCLTFRVLAHFSVSHSFLSHGVLSPWSVDSSVLPRTRRHTPPSSLQSYNPGQNVWDKVPFSRIAAIFARSPPPPPPPLAPHSSLSLRTTLHGGRGGR